MSIKCSSKVDVPIYWHCKSGERKIHMKRKLCERLALCLALAVIFSLWVIPTAEAAGEVYVNDSSGTLGTDIGSACVVGSGGEVAVTGDTYAITGNGVVKVGQNSPPAPSGLPSGEPDGSTVSVNVKTVRVGLRWSSNALSTANLENSVGSGYQFGYYDSDRNFHEEASTTETRLTMQPFGSGTGVIVYSTDTGAAIYYHTDSSQNLAIRPVSSSGKAVTWFKGNTYYGDFEYFRRQGENRLTVIGVLPLDDYVKGVVPYEVSASWPLEAQKAQAVCARTYVVHYIKNYPTRWAQYNFDVTNDTYCQAYGGTQRADSNSNAAVDQTAGEVLTYDGKVCSAVYASSFGGGSENSENVWGSVTPYLRGVIDPYEQAAAKENSNSTWTSVFTPAQLGAKVGLGEIAGVEPTYSSTNNCIKLVLTDTSGRSKTIEQDNCRTTLGVSNIHYTIKQDENGNFVFTGSGWGHNLGMSQFGAYAIAKYYGGNYRQILRFYYTGIKISRVV